jgi:ATP-binding cassette, subfamily B, multidrug efflux pump
MLKLILSYLKGSARACAVLAPLMMILEVVMDLQQPVLMSRIIDVGVARGDLAYVLGTGLIMLAMAAVGLVGGGACSILAAKAAVPMAGAMREALFAKVQSLSFAKIDEFETSSLVTRLTNDVMQMQSMFIMMLRIMVRTPITLVGSIVMAVIISPRLSLVLLVALPFVVFSISWVLAKSVPLFGEVQKSVDRVNGIQRESLLGARVVKAFTMEGRLAERFELANEELTRRSVAAQGLTFLLLPSVTFAMNASVVAALWFGASMVDSKGLEIGKIMAFINYLVQMTQSLMMAVNLIMSLSRAQASASRIDEVLDARTSVEEPRRAIAPSSYDIEFRNVSFSYGSGGEEVLKDLSFRIEEGETIGVIGATGSGKSSMACLIPRLYDASSGAVLIGGIDVRSMGFEALRSSAGIAMQESLLFSGTIASNLRFGDGEAGEEEMDGACEAAQAAEFIKLLPGGYESPVEQRARNLSGGQKQRLSLARSLLQKPRILILDDTTSAVDLKTEARMRSSLAKRLSGTTLIVIAQRISAVMQADRILVLDSGRLAAGGTHKELLASSEIYRSIVVSQLGEEAVDNAR